MTLFNDIDIVFHLHIPKSAGTSLRKSVFSVLPDDLCVEWNSPDPFDLAVSLESFSDVILRNPGVRVISGHFPYGVHKVLSGKTYKYYSVLRHPVDRIISNFRHSSVYNLHLMSPDERCMIILGGFDEYVRSSFAEITYINSQARLISGLLNNAQLYSFDQQSFINFIGDIIDKDYLHLGFSDDLTATIKFLNDFYFLGSDVKLEEFRENVGIPESSFNILPKLEFDDLMMLNSYDLSLINLLSDARYLNRDSNALAVDKDTFFSKVIKDSALEMSRQLHLSMS